MAKMHYGCLNPHEFEVQFPYAITSVVYDPMMLDINGDPVPNALAQVSLQCLRDGTRIKIPIVRDSMVLLPSPQQRALEHEIKLKEGVIEAKNAMLAELRAEIGSLKSSLAATTFAAESWQKHSDKQVAETKRLEKVCASHWNARNDAERKWTETVGELDNTKNQLKEVRTANSQLLNANSCQASKIQALESQLNLLKHQYEGKCQVVRDLRTAGLSKERDEYSKALGQKDVQISQITKQAGEWKQTATTRAKEIDRLSALVLERSQELAQCQRENTNLRVANSMTASGPCNTKPPVGVNLWAECPLPHYQKPIELAHPGTLPTRVQNPETRVTKLEEADGFPMESYNVRDPDPAMLYMGGQWREGFRGLLDGKFRFLTCCPGIQNNGMTSTWDKANQPTRWKPMPQ